MESEKDILRKVRRLEIKSRGLSNEIFAGQYHSAFRGRGMSFSEVREYRMGDDVRDIDWNVTARSNKAHIKIYEEERELTVMLLVDVSPSVDFGTAGQTKRALQTEIAAVLAFSASQTGDKVGAMLFSGGVEKFIPPAKGRAHVLRIIRELIGYDSTLHVFDTESHAMLSDGWAEAAASRRRPKLSVSRRRGGEGKEGAAAEASEEPAFASRSSSSHLISSPNFTLKSTVFTKRATTCVLSDFLYPASDEGALRDALKIATGKHDIVAIRVEDRREAEMPDVGIATFEDSETGRRVWVDTSSRAARDDYARSYRERVDAVEGLLRHYRVDTAVAATGEDYVRELVKLFKRR